MHPVIEFGDAPLLRYTRAAMATLFEIVVPCGMASAADSAEAAFEQIDDLESQLSVFRESSEVSRLNRIAFQAPCPVEPCLFRLLQRCSALTRQTHGAFDITSGPLTIAWGFLQRNGRQPSDEELAAAMACIGMDKVLFDDTERKLKFARPGISINLGSVGKGYALDRVRETVRDKFDISAGMLSAGTSSVVAWGDRDWKIGVKHPFENRRLGSVCLRNRAMACSGSANQHFEHDGRRLGHLIDPRSGRPVEGTTLAIAIAPTAADADALATAFFVLGVDGTRDYCAQHLDIAAVMLTDDPDAQLTVINTGNEWTMASRDEFYELPGSCD